MTLDEAAMIWGESISEDLVSAGRGADPAANTLIRVLKLNPAGDPWPGFTSDYVSLACVMYAQDVAEGRHLK